MTSTPLKERSFDVAVLCSSVARGATYKTFDSILANEALSQLDLIGRGSIAHVEDLVPGANVALRMAMAVEAPFHGERLSLPHERHLIDTAVTGSTTNSFVNVNTVIEVNVIRQIIYSRPLNRLAGSVAFAHGLQFGADGP